MDFPLCHSHQCIDQMEMIAFMFMNGLSDDDRQYDLNSIYLNNTTGMIYSHSCCQHHNKCFREFWFDWCQSSEWFWSKITSFCIFSTLLETMIVNWVSVFRESSLRAKAWNWRQSMVNGQWRNFTLSYCHLFSISKSDEMKCCSSLFVSTVLGLIQNTIPTCHRASTQ